MISWIRKHPYGTWVMVLIACLAFGAATVANQFICRNYNKVVKNWPLKYQSSVYLGKNLSITADSITGSTVHMNYKNFIKYSSIAIETYLVRENRINSTESQDVVYALMSNGHTYSTVLNTDPPGPFYIETNRKIDSKTGELKIFWTRTTPKPDLFFYLLALIISLASCLLTWVVVDIFWKFRTKKLTFS